MWICNICNLRHRDSTSFLLKYYVVKPTKFCKRSSESSQTVCIMGIYMRVSADVLMYIPPACLPFTLLYFLIYIAIQSFFFFTDFKYSHFSSFYFSPFSNLTSQKSKQATLFNAYFSSKLYLSWWILYKYIQKLYYVMS